MARTSRLLVEEEEVVYHVITRTALEGFVLGDIEKEFLVDLITWMSSVFFTDVYGYCVMGDHFHLLVKMKSSQKCSSEEARERLERYYKGKEGQLTKVRLFKLKSRLSNLSAYIKDIKQRFSRYYNKKHKRKGYFWAERFKSVIVEEGETLVNCLAYIDLNPLRAKIVDKPEDYRWSSLGYRVQNKGKENFLSSDFGISEYKKMNEKERIEAYIEYVYEKGAINSEEGEFIYNNEFNEKDDYIPTTTGRLRYRTRHFSDSAVIGTKGFVSKYSMKFKSHFNAKREKRPIKISGLDDTYSLKSLVEDI